MAQKARTVLSRSQAQVLVAVGQNDFLSKHFYLTGGTALAEFYLHHRFSEDLDFFSEEEFESEGVAVFFKQKQKTLGIKKVAYEQSFNRHLFFLHLNDGAVIKTEFTFFPFPVIDKKSKRAGLLIDSLLDIAVNKIFTVYQKPRSRDFIDLFFIIKKTGWPLAELVKKARIKFDWHIDHLQLGSQLLQVKYLKDYPRLIKKIQSKVWQDFFVKEAQKLGRNILE